MAPPPLNENDFMYAGQGLCADQDEAIFSFGQPNGKGTESECRNECALYDREGLVGFAVDSKLNQCYCHYDKGYIPEDVFAFTKAHDGSGTVQRVVVDPKSPDAACYILLFPNWVKDWDDDLPLENKGFMQDICEGDAGRCAAQIIVILFLVFLPCAILSCICLWKKKKEGKDIFATMRTWKMPTISFRSIRSTQSTAVLPITSGNKQIKRKRVSTDKLKKAASFQGVNHRMKPMVGELSIASGNNQIKRKKVSTDKLRKAASFQGVNHRMKPMVGELPEHYELRVQLFKKRSELWEIKQRKKDLLNDQNKINSLIEKLETEQTRLSFRESALKKLEMTTPDSRTRFSFQDFVDKFYFQNVSDDFVNTNSIGIMVKADAEANGYDLGTALSSRSSKDVCAVCFNGFCVGDGICTPIIETCEHVFHPECAEEWVCIDALVIMVVFVLFVVSQVSNFQFYIFVSLKEAHAAHFANAICWEKREDDAPTRLRWQDK